MTTELNRFLSLLALDVFCMDENNWRERMKALLQKFEPVQNPLPGHGGVATRQNVYPGAKLLVVGYNGFARADEYVVTDVFLHPSVKSEFIRTPMGKHFNYSLVDMGVLPDETSGWNPHYTTFVNDAPTRRAVAEWLASKGGKAAESAVLLTRKHPDEFAFEPAVENGKIVGALKQMA